MEGWLNRFLRHWKALLAAWIGLFVAGGFVALFIGGGSDSSSPESPPAYNPVTFLACVENDARVFSPLMRAPSTKYLHINDLAVPEWAQGRVDPAALRADEFVVFFQPIFAETGTDQPLDPTFGEQDPETGVIGIKPVHGAFVFYDSNPDPAVLGPADAYANEDNLVVLFSADPSPSQRDAVRDCVDEAGGLGPTIRGPSADERLAAIEVGLQVAKLDRRRLIGPGHLNKVEAITVDGPEVFLAINFDPTVRQGIVRRLCRAIARLVTQPTASLAGPHERVTCEQALAAPKGRRPAHSS